MLTNEEGNEDNYGSSKIGTYALNEWSVTNWVVCDMMKFELTVLDMILTVLLTSMQFAYVNDKMTKDLLHHLMDLGYLMDVEDN